MALSLDNHGAKIAEGHKASFCLEDSECDKGTQRVYNCTNKGDQGISVGCADNYKNNIDCQWIDVTDIDAGDYVIRVNVNPTRNVPESDYANNAAFCNIKLNSTAVVASQCSIGKMLIQDRYNRRQVPSALNRLAVTGAQFSQRRDGLVVRSLNTCSQG